MASVDKSLNDSPQDAALLYPHAAIDAEMKSPCDPPDGAPQPDRGDPLPQIWSIPFVNSTSEASSPRSTTMSTGEKPALPVQSAAQSEPTRDPTIAHDQPCGDSPADSSGTVELPPTNEALEGSTSAFEPFKRDGPVGPSETVEVASPTSGESRDGAFLTSRLRKACDRCHCHRSRCIMTSSGKCEECLARGIECKRRLEKKRGRPLVTAANIDQHLERRQQRVRTKLAAKTAALVDVSLGLPAIPQLDLTQPLDPRLQDAYAAGAQAAVAAHHYAAMAQFQQHALMAPPSSVAIPFATHATLLAASMATPPAQMPFAMAATNPFHTHSRLLGDIMGLAGAPHLPAAPMPWPYVQHQFLPNQMRQPEAPEPLLLEAPSTAPSDPTEATDPEPVD